jgi:hypothetical protein
MIHHPKGAIKSIFDFKKAAVPGAVFYMIFNYNKRALNNYRFTINNTFRINEDHANRRWVFNVDMINVDTQEEAPDHQFWSPYGNLHFPTVRGECGFLFDNYWHAYAYKLRSKKSA